ncbi:MAG: pentapeptide repeat-containing protein, partial [Casimicrobium sp.]
ANLSGSNLRNAQITDAQLQSANLQGANLSGTSLSGSDLTGANLTDANLEGTNLRRANVSNTLIDADLNRRSLASLIANPSTAHSVERNVRTLNESEIKQTDDIDRYYREAYGQDSALTKKERERIESYLARSDVNLQIKGFTVADVLKYANDHNISDRVAAAEALHNEALANEAFSPLAGLASKVRRGMFGNATIDLTGVDLRDRPLLVAELRALQVQYPKLDVKLAGANLSGLDLRGMNFSSYDLDSTNFSGANLDNVDFSKASLSHANFDKATLTLARFDGANLTDASLIGSDLTGAKFRNGTVAIDASFSEATLEYVIADDADFSGAKFSGANLSGARFKRCDFENAHFVSAYANKLDCKDCDFSGAKLDYAVFDEFRDSSINISFSNCDFKNASLQYAIFRNVDFSSSEILSTSAFVGADFTGADLRGSTIVMNLNARGTVLKDTLLPNSTFTGESEAQRIAKTTLPQDWQERDAATFDEALNGTASNPEANAPEVNVSLTSGNINNELTYIADAQSTALTPVAFEVIATRANNTWNAHQPLEIRVSDGERTQNVAVQPGISTVTPPSVYGRATLVIPDGQGDLVIVIRAKYTDADGKTHYSDPMVYRSGNATNN